MGWDLFKNYVIAKEIFEPDFFLYENNKSASPEIKEQIHSCLGGHLTHINSALVSAQNRQRFYVTNAPVPQPEDRGIKLADVLETDASCAQTLYRLGYLTDTDTQSGIVRLGTIENSSKNKSFDSQQYRVHSPAGKSVTLCGNGGGVGAKTGLYFVPLSDREMAYMLRTTADGRNHFDFAHHSDASCDKSSCVVSNFHKGVPYNVLCDHRPELYVGLPIYSVQDGKMFFQDEWYSVPMSDGQYVIRKLTPVECERLQTLPDGYTDGISATQRYKCLGNGWTAEVIIHILGHLLEGVPRDEELIVLSMYDGIATGRYCLEKMGFTNITYHAFEIDRYAIQIANKHYPDIIHNGDAFGVSEWRYK